MRMRIRKHRCWRDGEMTWGLRSCGRVWYWLWQAGTKSELRYFPQAGAHRAGAWQSGEPRRSEVRWGEMRVRLDDIISHWAQTNCYPAAINTSNTDQRVVGARIKIEQNLDKNWLLFLYSFIFIYLLSAHFKNLFLDTDWIPGTGGEVFTFNSFW